ncbi:MAG: hypothetical protein JNJ94_16725 [Chlorobi bacterium]|nr:hypothetical protein [Chlorobiota bacterium]
MTIQEQIIALLNGDLTNQPEAAELLHVLSVSPEKQALLIEQIRMARGYANLRANLTPPPAADAAILQGLAGIDAAIGAPVVAPTLSPTPSTLPANSSASVASSLSWYSRPSIRAVAASLLLVAGVGIGYLLFHRTDATIAESASGQSGAQVQLQTGGDGVSQADSAAMLRGYVGQLQQQLATANQNYGVALAQIESLRNRPTQTRTITLRNIVHDTVHDTVLIAATPPAAMATADVSGGVDSSSAVQPLSLHGPSHPAIVLDSLMLINAPAIALRSPSVASQGDAASKHRWQVGLRNHFRMSLPKIEGLPNLQNTLTDREGFISYAMQNQQGLPQLNIGAAVGETQFGLMYHTNTGGAQTDTVFLTTPILNYGRLWVAPTLLTIGEHLSASVELGGGGTEIGPFGTAGVAMEYQAGERATLHAGLASWFLWTAFRDQLYTSTNLNGSIGIAFRW